MRMPPRITPEGYPFIFLSAFAGIFTSIHWHFFATPFLMSTTMFAYFFRDPERVTPEGDHFVVSPADGRVVAIEPIQLDHQRFNRISIYLSLWDVHITRSPYAGQVERIDYTPGEFNLAFTEKARKYNENNLISLTTPDENKVTVRQIAGGIARRIVCYCRPGQSIERGQKVGMIKFGSCVQTEIPVSAALRVAVGDKVKGGESVLAEFPSCVSKKECC